MTGCYMCFEELATAGITSNSTTLLERLKVVMQNSMVIRMCFLRTAHLLH